MEKVIRFNPINEYEFSFDWIETNWKVVDEFYYSTNKGPITRGELWKDTPLNRELIEKIIQNKKHLKQYRDELISSNYALMNQREK